MKCLNVLDKTYYFIFEEDLYQAEEGGYDYLVITMEKGKNPNEMYVQDIAKKLNDYQSQFKLSCIVSDEKTIFLILFAKVEMMETPMNDLLSN